jgi:orotate phosphoribosyltransferase
MRTHSETENQLLALLKKRSVFHGDFTLASGAKSKYYIDCRLTTLDPAGAHLVGKTMLDLIRNEAQARGLTPNAVGGLTMGADPIALAVAMTSFKETPAAPLKCFVVRKAPKSHGQTKLIEGGFKSGDKVVVIDDVVTRGDSTIAAINAIKNEGGEILFAAVLVDRQEGGRQKIEDLGYKVVSAFVKDELLG